MKVICIAGHCGTGKTTAIKMLAEYLGNSSIIRGDKFWVDAILSQRKKFEEIYKMPLDIEKPYQCLISLSNNTKIENIENFFVLLCHLLKIK